ncbi:hypothetical protein HYALB_00012976 [Hymenoscyphus albidus]|uniref:Uncharacterized protein n=1 Tax=Hymenoscyphus albidus TaxID=595503 RepID=A0A9N9LYW8_9HELO|nr:hypothetical protein HYALB_00012976 [Hymenoscyphus albidus]
MTNPPANAHPNYRGYIQATGARRQGQWTSTRNLNPLKQTRKQNKEEQENQGKRWEGQLTNIAPPQINQSFRSKRSQCVTSPDNAVVTPQHRVSLWNAFENALNPIEKVDQVGGRVRIHALNFIEKNQGLRRGDVFNGSFLKHPGGVLLFPCGMEKGSARGGVRVAVTGSGG